MKITMDPVANASYIELRRGPVSRTMELSRDVLVDFGKSGEVIGIEILSDSFPPPGKKTRQVGKKPGKAAKSLRPNKKKSSAA